MTAEIAVMNRDAVALAADSTVTVSGRKAYHTTNKLFALSRFHPIGVMIYGSAEIGGIPWETLIKVYRQKLGDKKFDQLKDYKDDFIRFLESDISEYNPEGLNEIFLDYVEKYLEALVDHIDSKVEHIIDQVGQISKAEIKILLQNAINDLQKKEESRELMPMFSDSASFDQLKALYSDSIRDLAKEKLEKHRLTKADISSIISTAIRIFCSKSELITGIVFAGFGDRDLFPRLCVCKIECIALGKVKFTENFVEVDNRDNSAVVYPFAQTDTVTTFVEGMSQSMRRAVLSGFSAFAETFSKKIVDKLSSAKVSTKRIDAVSAELSTLRKEAREAFKDYVTKQQHKFHILPLIEAVQFLPKNEMAEVAESLVSITSFKQKISLEQESVGGAIDVAVISKCDGFVWIKRKHYFEADLNPMFFSKYINGHSSPGA